jgi:hypothetical protein
MYSSKDKQRESVREATRRYRLKKGITKVSPGITGVSQKGDVMKVSPEVVEGGRFVREGDAIIYKGRLESALPVLHHPACRCFVCVPPKEQ